MVEDIVFVARSGFVGAHCRRHSLFNSGDLLQTAGKSDDAWIEGLGVFPLTSGMSRSDRRSICRDKSHRSPSLWRYEREWAPTVTCAVSARACLRKRFEVPRSTRP